VFGKHTLDLDAAEFADGIPWPPITVMVVQVAGDPAAVLLEVGPVASRTGCPASRPGGSVGRSSARRTWRTR
jgi:hypothetical protein